MFRPLPAASGAVDRRRSSASIASSDSPLRSSAGYAPAWLQSSPYGNPNPSEAMPRLPGTTPAHPRLRRGARPCDITPSSSPCCTMPPWSLSLPPMLTIGSDTVVCGYGVVTRCCWGGSAQVDAPLLGCSLCRHCCGARCDSHIGGKAVQRPQPRHRPLYLYCHGCSCSRL